MAVQPLGPRHRQHLADPVEGADRGAAGAQDHPGRQPARRPVGARSRRPARAGSIAWSASVATFTRSAWPIPATRAALSTEEWVSALA